MYASLTTDTIARRLNEAGATPAHLRDGIDCSTHPLAETILHMDDGDLRTDGVRSLDSAALYKTARECCLAFSDDRLRYDSAAPGGQAWVAIYR